MTMTMCERSGKWQIHCCTISLRIKVYSSVFCWFVLGLCGTDLITNDKRNKREWWCYSEIRKDRNSLKDRQAQAEWTKNQKDTAKQAEQTDIDGKTPEWDGPDKYGQSDGPNIWTTTLTETTPKQGWRLLQMQGPDRRQRPGWRLNRANKNTEQQWWMTSTRCRNGDGQTG